MFYDARTCMYLSNDNSQSIDDFAMELINERDRRVTPVVGRFKDICIMVRFGDTVEDVVKYYNEQYDKLTDTELKRNAEHYVDPTAYKAIKKADRDAEHEKVRKLVGCLNRVCELSGFSIVGRVELLDEKTGKVWK